MFAYRVYGLGLHSELPIPELLASPSAAPDIVVMRAALAPPAPPSAQAVRPGDAVDESWAERSGDTTRCVFEGVGHYLIEEGRRILVDAAAGADDAVVRHLLLGPVLAHLLWQRGIFTLHASVLRVQGRSLAFVGVSGEGKSTTAAALGAAGHGLVCDDVAALTVVGERIRVLPGFPRIRLHDDSIMGIGDRPQAHPAVHPHIDKRSKAVTRFVAEEVWLDRLYVLDTGSAFVIDKLGASDALMEVLRHTYYAHQYAPLYGFPHHLAEATRVVQRVASYRFTRPRDLTRLPELVGCIEAHVAT